MTITVLTENTSADPRLGCEHGLSLYIEACGLRLLFDMGQSELFARNARLLGVDLEKVDLAVISHGHYDHGGGLATFLNRNSHAPVYLSCYAFEPHFNAAGKDIGLDPSLKRAERLRPVKGKVELAPGVTLYSHCPRPYGVDSAGQSFEAEGRRLPEDFRHELYLMLEEKGKRVLISGCSHGGIRNIAEHFRPDVLIGGFHFFKRPLDETLAKEAVALGGLGIRFYTGHCTGEAQLAFLRPLIPNLQAFRTGDVLSGI